MKYERLAGCATCQTINVLNVAACAESCEDKRLCFTTVKDRRTMNTWDHAGVARDRAEVVGATTVHATACFEDVLAVELLLNFVECTSDVVAVDIFSTKLLFKGFSRFLDDYLDCELTCGVAILCKCALNLLCGEFFTESRDFFWCDYKVEFLLLFASYLREFLLCRDDWLDGFLTILKGFVETLIRDELAEPSIIIISVSYRRR